MIEEKEQEIECPYCAEKVKLKAKKCKHCSEILDISLRAAEEAKKSNTSNVYMNAAASAPAVVVVESSRSVGFILGIGILLLPYIFAWVTLSKGYSTGARIISFFWMIIVVLAMIGKSKG